MVQSLHSVAIPAYNHAKYIEACLNSVAAQTYAELEIVFIDDGSSDETFAMAKAFLDRHRDRFRRIVAYTRPNRGVSATSNECVQQCAGEWVHLLGSDDLLHPEKIARQSAAIDAWAEPRLGLVYSDVDCVDPDSRLIKKATRKRPFPGPDFEAYRWLLRDNFISNPTVALRKAAFLDVGGFDRSLRLEDWDCWLRISAKYAIARVPEILASYRLHPTNSSKNAHMMLEAQFLTFAKFLEQHPNLIPKEIQGNSYRKHLRRLRRWAAHHHRAALPRILLDAMASSEHRAPPIIAATQRACFKNGRCC